MDNKIIKAAFNKFRHDDNLSAEEEMEVIKFIDTFVTCSSDKDEAKKLLIRECGDKNAVAEKAVDIAKTVNKHKHNRTCRKYNTKCRFNYPKYPSTRTIITQSPEIFYKNELNKFQDDLEAHDKWLSDKMISNNKILQCVREVLEAYDKLEPGDKKLVEMEGKATHDAIMSILMIPDIQKHILSNEDIFERYEEALITSGKSAKSIITKRHPKDRYMNNYNPEWIFAWNGNMDLQVCLDFFQIISYITDYYSKDDTGTIEYLKKAKKEMTDKNMPQQLRQMANTFLSHRQMGEAEAVYRVTPDLHLTETNVKCVYVQT